MADVTAPTPRESEAHTTLAMPMRRVAVASFIGTTIEFYDFYIYGTAAALFFNQIFFPQLDPVTGTLAAFSTFAVAFAARPLGSVLFGHFGDRIGRKSMLVTSLLVMGLATFAIGLLPGYGALGVGAPVLLVVLRFLQGLGLGGEWGGAVLLATEHAPAGRRGLYAMFPQLGPSMGFLLSSGLFLVLGFVLDDAAFGSWGWRVPFLVSIVLVAVGLYVRLRIAETPAFRRVIERRERSRVPIVDVLRTHPRELVLGSGVMIIQYVLFYTATTYGLAYGVNQLGIARTTMLLLTMLAVVFMALATSSSSAVADRWGRRPVILATCAVAAVWGVVMFPLLDTRALPLVALALIGALAAMGTMYGPIGAYLPELFRSRLRYSGAAVSYNLGGVLGGALAPIVATSLQASFGSMAVGLYVTAMAVVSLLCVLGLGETKDRSMLDSG